MHRLLDCAAQLTELKTETPRPEQLTCEAALKTIAPAATLRRHDISDHCGHDLRADPPARTVRACTASASMKSGIDVLCAAAPFKIMHRRRHIPYQRLACPRDRGVLP